MTAPQEYLISSDALEKAKRLLRTRMSSEQYYGVLNCLESARPYSPTTTSAREVLELSKGELFHLECMIEEELKGLLGQAKVRCPLCRAMLKKIKYLKEADHEKTL